MRTLTLTTNLNTDMLNSAWEGNLYAGYGARWKFLFGGLEAFARYSNNRLSATKDSHFLLVGPTDINNIATSSLKIGPWHCGLDFRPGFFLNLDTLLYARLGVEWTRQTLSSSVRFVNTGSVAPSDVSFGSSTNKHSAYLRLGAGVEKKIADALTFRLDYLFTDYGSVNISRQVAIDTATLTDATTVKLQNHALLVGLSYYFSECNPCFSCDPCKPVFSGVYMAGIVGGALYNGKLNAGSNRGVVVSGGSTRINSVTFPSHIADTLFNGSLYAGYGLQWRFLYAGLEAFGQYAPFSRTRTDSSNLVQGAAIRSATFNTTTRIDPWQLGLGFRPGFLVTPTTLLYGTIGTSYAQISLSSLGNTLYTSPDTNLSLYLEDHSNRMTLRAGGGLEYAFLSTWHLRVDYLFTDYGSLQVQGSRTTVALGVTTSVITDIKVHPQTHAVSLGIAKYF